MPGAKMNGSKLEETKVLQSNKISSRKEEDTVLVPPCHERARAKSRQAVPPSLVRSDSMSTISSDGDSDDPVETCMGQFYDMLGKRVDDMLYNCTEEKGKRARVITKKVVNRSSDGTNSVASNDSVKKRLKTLQLVKKNSGEKFTNEESDTILNAFWSLCGSSCLEDQVLYISEMPEPVSPLEKLNRDTSSGSAAVSLHDRKASLFMLNGPTEAEIEDEKRAADLQLAIAIPSKRPFNWKPPSTSQKKISFKRPSVGAKDRSANIKPLEKATGKDDNKNIKISSSSTSTIESPQSELNPAIEKDDNKKIKISSSSTSPIESPQSEINALTSKNGAPDAHQAATVLVEVESNHTQTMKDKDKVDDIDSTPIPSSQSVASDRSSKSLDEASPSGCKDSPSAASGADTSQNSKQDDDTEFPDDECHEEKVQEDVKSAISEVAPSKGELAPSKGELAPFKGEQSGNFSDSHKTIDDVSDLVTETVEVPNGESGLESQDGKMDGDPTLNATEINSEKSEIDGSTKKSESDSDVTANLEAHDEKLVNVDDHDEKHEEMTDVSDMPNESPPDVLGFLKEESQEQKQQELETEETGTE